MLMRNGLLGVAVACLVIAGCGRDCTGAGCSGDVGLQVENYITGLQRPWDIGWLPNGTVLVTERPGPLKVFADGVDEDPISITLDDLVSTGGEGGMMGLEVDPDFDDNGYIYICMASSMDEVGVHRKWCSSTMVSIASSGTAGSMREVMSGADHIWPSSWTSS